MSSSGTIEETEREVRERAARAKSAFYRLAQLSSDEKNQVLRAWAEGIHAAKDHIRYANDQDLELARETGLSGAMIDRLTLSSERIDDIVRAIEEVALLPDPVGLEISRLVKPDGLCIIKRRVPIGLIAIIYESRPNVTAEAAALCFKASNSVVLRGGKEATHSNRALLEAITESGAAVGMPDGAVELINSTARSGVKNLVQLDGLVDLVIPRGGEGLIRTVTELARVPVIKHYKGVCHLYVDQAADSKMATEIAVNAKCQRPGVCNAIETLLVHEEIAPELLPSLAKELSSRKVELRCDEASYRILAETCPEIKPDLADEADWSEEYLDLILSIKVVPSLDEAIQHINYYGSHHSDAIISNDRRAQERFSKEVDSAAVYTNASTRFTDGGQFGLGAEIGISTDKLHARGPMGLEELTTYKFVVKGHGHIR